MAMAADGGQSLQSPSLLLLQVLVLLLLVLFLVLLLRLAQGGGLVFVCRESRVHLLPAWEAATAWPLNAAA
jgi:hypothetical protein